MMPAEQKVCPGREALFPVAGNVILEGWEMDEATLVGEERVG